MPIYCSNTGNTAIVRKQASNIMSDFVGTNNYYMSTGQQTSAASYHILHNKNISSSLIMAINRLRKSVKDMRETILIPTRLAHLDTRDDDDSDSGNSSSSHSSASSTITEFNTNPTLLSMNRHNLYEQYKLLDMIDKLVSCDTFLNFK